MHAQHELAVVGREEQVLPSPLRSGEPASLERASGGSNVFSVAMCAGPAWSTGARETSGSSSRTQASTSGSSGMRIVSLTMDGPIQVEVTRGSVVEAVHTVHVVAVADGRVVASAGDPQLVDVPALLGEADPGPAARPGAPGCR